MKKLDFLVSYLNIEKVEKYPFQMITYLSISSTFSTR